MLREILANEVRQAGLGSRRNEKALATLWVGVAGFALGWLFAHLLFWAGLTEWVLP